VRSSPPRIPLVDAARGVALAGMAVYHLVWDLTFYRLIPRDIFLDPRFQAFGHLVAIAFLTLVGVSLALASRAGFDARAFGRRLAMVGGAAALVSLGTYVYLPEAFVSFGILHCIFAASLLAAPFVRGPWIVPLVLGLALALAPLALRSEAFNASNWWLGLGIAEPRSLDWRPLLPWSGFTLMGLGLARAWLARGVPARIVGWRAQGPAGRALALAGRRSLLVYLVHQPVLIGLVFLAAWVTGPIAGVAEAEARFRGACAEQCAAAGPDLAWCERACGCVEAQAKRESLWRQTLENRFTAQERARFDDIARACLRPAAPPP